ncbi:GspE/PulE family protein [Acinetobacter boissieri]|uniref:General secretion pathway protein E n=1 Tax=Acinetobacter boissieri TaxID=1219383 RepID=A0A1G6GSX4_9GAMM|nr:GspE/PulE family protein [Acinetobacter boissieri]SDB84276.1 general secretion pathway protein E [Acinetobacter boissieri]
MMDSKQQTQYSFLIDLQWSLQALVTDGLMSERDKILVQTTPRNKNNIAMHPLQWIATFNIKHQQDQQQMLNLTVLMRWLADKSGLVLFTVDPLNADVSNLTQVMSQEFAFKNNILAVAKNTEEVTIATDQPFFTDWQRSLEQSIKPKTVKRVLLSPEHLKRYLAEYYQVSRAVRFSEKKQQRFDTNSVEALLEIGQSNQPDANDQHIVKLVDWVLEFAFEQGASDIHLEPRKEKSNIRFRIDGILHTIYQMPSNTMTAVIARIKILGRMNVAEKRKPQDGRLKTRTTKGLETELRLATLPTAFGEKMVMRVFDPEVLVRGFEQLGFDRNLHQQWQEMTKNTHGIILVTGPTGSGKTTTLYSSLKHLATEEVNVCTIEDPIEMIEDSFNQMQVNTGIDLGFVDGIRALMRQDPDVIMVGEIRDQDTADMAVQAALTGHLVLSTLHTNDAPSSLMRLNDLGVQPFLTASTLLGVLAQRLLRTLCPKCKTQTAVDVQAWQKLTSGYTVTVPTLAYSAVGCEACRYTGYKGRMGVYEFMPVSLAIKHMISEDEPLSRIRHQAKLDGVEPLRIAGARKVMQGITSIDEVLRVVPLT